MIDSKTEKASLCRPDHVVDSILGWTYSWMTRGTESERARKTGRKREYAFWQKNYAKHTNDHPKDHHSQLWRCARVRAGKSGIDSNERPVSCISDHLSAHSCSLFHSVCISPWSQSITHWTPDKVSLNLLAWRCRIKLWWCEGKQWNAEHTHKLLVLIKSVAK